MLAKHFTTELLQTFYFLLIFMLFESVLFTGLRKVSSSLFNSLLNQNDQDVKMFIYIHSFIHCVYV